jgi:hypothetical protein
MNFASSKALTLQAFSNMKWATNEHVFIAVSASLQDNFTVMVANDHPLSGTGSPLTNPYVICGQWPGPAPAGQTMFVSCAGIWPLTQFQHVIIRGFEDKLNFCELEVYTTGSLSYSPPFNF